MANGLTELFGPDEDRWNTPAEEAKRQAIASLRGYAYQLQQSLAAWIALPDDGTLHLEVAEDYAEIVRDPASLDTILEATQIKDTRESGSVTLNSKDVLDAIRNFWALSEANPDRPVRFLFLTTSPIGRERLDPLASTIPALEVWQRAARGGPVDELREALKARFGSETAIGAFLDASDDDGLRQRLIVPMRWACGAPDFKGVADDNRASLIVLGQSLGGTPDLSARAADILLSFILSTIIDSPDRRLRRGDLLEQIYSAITVRIPIQQMMGAAREARGLDLEASGAWRSVEPIDAPHAKRSGIAQDLRTALGITGSLWLHGATGLGKSMLAEILALSANGIWRLLDLRGASGQAARERLVAARAAILTDPGVTGLIVDDVSPSTAQEIEAALDDLAASSARRGIFLVFTSNHPPDRRLERALGLDEKSICLVPSFGRDDAAELVAAYGGDPAKWSLFVLIASNAHPQLADAVTAGLARRNWPDGAMQDFAKEGMRNVDAEAEREGARRRLLAELQPDVLQLLGRTVRIHRSFDRELALAVASVDPALPAAGLGLDQLIGHWIERLGHGRYRSSPLVERLDQEMLDGSAIRAIDVTIARHLLLRQSLAADFAETVFVHAIAAEEGGWITVLVNAMLQSSDDERPLLASAMPMFRGMSALPRFIDDRPFAVLLFRLAQHRLITSIGSQEDLEKSASAVLAALDQVNAQHGQSDDDFAPVAADVAVGDDSGDVGDPADKPDDRLLDSGTVLALSTVLNDNFAFGRISGWFGLVRQFQETVRRSPDVLELVSQAQAMAGIGYAEFLFIAHATRLGGTRALADLFQDLDALEPDERDHWLDAMETPRPIMAMIIDHSWLKEAERGSIDSDAQASLFKELGDQALQWGRERLAGHCFRAEALMLDEYGRDPAAALAALDRAEGLIPNSFQIARERAKIAWRAHDHAGALEQHLALECRLDETEGYDAAFAMREAGMSAAELQRWDDAARLFELGQRHALRAAEGQAGALSIGLGAEAAASCFEAGDWPGGIKKLTEVLDELAELDPSSSLAAHSTHVVARHLVLFMLSRFEPVEAGEEQPVFVPGSASNPGPHAGIAAHPVSALAPAWFMLARAAAPAGIPIDEIITWPGLIAARRSAIIDALVRIWLIERAIEQRSADRFVCALVPAVEAFDHMARLQASGDEPDPLHPLEGTIEPLDPKALQEGEAREAIRNSALTFLLVAQGLEDKEIDAFIADLVTAVGYDPIPEWSGSAPDPVQLQSLVSSYLAALRNVASLGLEDLFVAHLRLFEWARISRHRALALAKLAERVREDWQLVLATRRALLIAPAFNLPAIEQALSSKGEDAPVIAGILLAVEPAVSVGLGAEFRELLRSA